VTHSGLDLPTVRIGVAAERAPGERRVAATPASVAVYRGWGWEVVVATGAGTSAGFPDDAYREAGAAIGDPAGADIMLVVGPPDPGFAAALAPGSLLLGHLDPFVSTDLVVACRDAGITALAVEAVPRTTLAQSMDALSSQATVAGYAAVLLAAETSPKFLAMLVTAAGTIPPARALVLGAGVAGLQAIATARRLGAVVYGYDIRSATREQVESLGARFVEAPTEEADDGGYAREVGADTQAQQLETLAPYVADSDIVVTTAQIPGKPAPRLIDAAMVAAMHPGAVIVDMAASSGGNVEGSRPDESVVVDGVTILGPTDLASRVPTDASRMYARNLQELLGRLRTDEGIAVDLSDEIIGGTTITHAGEVVHPRSQELVS